MYKLAVSKFTKKKGENIPGNWSREILAQPSRAQNSVKTKSYRKSLNALMVMRKRFVQRVQGASTTPVPIPSSPSTELRGE